MKNRIILASLLLLIIILTQSCGIGYVVRGAAKKSITKENQVVPQDFIEDDQTLLILLWGTKSYDKYAIKAFDKFYKGDKAYITISQYHNDPRFSDLDKYPYVFSQGPDEIELYSGGSYSYKFVGSRPFHIFDRKENTFFNSKVTSGYFFRIMQAYAMKLEYYRLKKIHKTVYKAR